MQLPRKLQSGDWLKQSTFRTVNGIIDYLATQRIVGDNQTIKVSQQNTGLTISAIPSPYGGSAIISSIVLPFKLAITANDTTKTLKVEKGIVRTAKTDLIYAYTLTLPDSAGTYNVYGYVQYDGTFSNGIFLIDSTKTVASCRGFYTFKIGTIEVKVENSETVYTITEQTAKSDIEIIDYEIFNPFCAYCYNSTSLHNTILTENFTPDRFKVNGGTNYVDEHENHTVNDFTGALSHLYIYYELTVNDPQSHSAKIVSSASPLAYFNGESPIDDKPDVYNILIAEINADGSINQRLTGDIVFGLTKQAVDQDGGGGGKTIDIDSSTLKVTETSTDSKVDFDINFDINSSLSFFTMSNKAFSIANKNDGLVWNTGDDLTVISIPNNSTPHYLQELNGNLSWVLPQYKVQVNGADTPDFLENKISSTDQSVRISVNNYKLDLSVDSRIKVNDNDPVASWLQNKIESSDSSISITVKTSASGYKLDLSATGGGKVLVDANDGYADYLGEKLVSTDDSVTFSKVYGSGTQLDLSAGKVKATDDDPSAGHLDQKLHTHESVLQMLLLVPYDDKLQLTCTSSNCLWYADENQKIQKINLPDGDFALTFSSSSKSFKWVKITDCENACSQESSSTGA